MQNLRQVEKQKEQRDSFCFTLNDKYEREIN
jgi:hypothetical protein